MSTTGKIQAHLRTESMTRLKKLRTIYGPTTQAHTLIQEEIQRRRQARGASPTSPTHHA